MLVWEYGIQVSVRMHWFHYKIGFLCISSGETYWFQLKCIAMPSLKHTDIIKLYIGFSKNVFFPMDSRGFQQEYIDFIKMCCLR